MEADIVGLMGQKEGKQKIVPQILVQVCTESKVVVSRAVFIITLSSKYELSLFPLSPKLYTLYNIPVTVYYIDSVTDQKQ